MAQRHRVHIYCDGEMVHSRVVEADEIGMHTEGDWLAVMVEKKLVATIYKGTVIVTPEPDEDDA